jgi:hypothetical protein
MTNAVQAPAGTDLYSRIQQFYAGQMQLLDAGAADEWAATFTVDGVFAANGFPQPARGRAAIMAGARQAVAERAGSGQVHRHWLGMLTVAPEPDGSVRATCYALVIQTERGGASTISRSTVCADLLVPEGDTWLVRHRQVTRDDLA